MTDIPPLGRNDAIESNTQSNNTVTVTNVTTPQVPRRDNDKITPDNGASLSANSTKPLAPAIDRDSTPTVASLAKPGETAQGANDKPLDTKPNTANSASSNSAVSTNAADLGGPITTTSSPTGGITTPRNATPDISITTSPAQRTDRIQAQQIQLGNTGRVEIMPSTPVGNLKLNLRTDVTLANPPLSSRTDSPTPAGDGGRQFTTGNFNVRASATTPDKGVVVGSVGLGVDPSRQEPLRSVSPGLEFYQLGENNGLGGITARTTFSRTPKDDLYLSGANVTGRVQLNGATDITFGPNLGFSQPGKENGGSVGGTVGIVQRSEYSEKTVRQTTTSVTVAVPDAGGISVTGTYSNGERNRFLSTDPDTAITVQYSNTPGKDTRFQIGVQFFNLP